MSMVGKKVVCVDAENSCAALELGKVYTVRGENGSYDYFVDDFEYSYCKERFDVVKEPVQLSRNKYMREVKPGVWIDVYDVLRAFNVTDPCLQHMLKKCLAAGGRGHKSTKEDLQDILASAQRAVEMHNEWEGTQ